MSFIDLSAWIVLAACAVATAVALAVARPLAADARRRVDRLVAGAASTAGEQTTGTARRRAGLEMVKRIFVFGLKHKWGVVSGPLILLLASAAASGATWLVAHLALGFPLWVSAALALSSAWAAPHGLVRFEQGRSEKRFVELFPEAIDMIVRLLRAGLPVSAAIQTVGREAPPPVGGVFATLADQIEIGIAFEDALRIGAERIGHADFQFFAAALALQHATGGNLVATLEILAEIIRRRRMVRLKARAATAEVRLSAYVLGAIPVFVFGALLTLNPRYLTPLIADPRGNVLLAVAVALLGAAFLTMRYLMRSILR